MCLVQFTISTSHLILQEFQRKDSSAASLTVMYSIKSRTHSLAFDMQKVPINLHKKL